MVHCKIILFLSTEHSPAHCGMSRCRVFDNSRHPRCIVLHGTPSEHFNWMPEVRLSRLKIQEESCVDWIRTEVGLGVGTNSIWVVYSGPKINLSE